MHFLNQLVWRKLMPVLSVSLIIKCVHLCFWGFSWTVYISEAAAFFWLLILAYLICTCAFFTALTRSHYTDVHLCLWNDLYCVRWGVKLSSLTPMCTVTNHWQYQYLFLWFDFAVSYASGRGFRHVSD